MHELAELAVVALQESASPQYEGITVERMENWLKRLSYEIAPVAIQAHQAGDLVGWLLLFFHDTRRAEINPWALNGHPFITSREEKQQVGLQLIEEAITYAGKAGITRIELSFRHVHEEDEHIYREYQRQYESLGFQFMTETALLRRPLSDFSLQASQLPRQFELKPLTEVRNEDLYPSYYAIFQTGQDRFFFDQNDEERRDFFDKTFDRKEPLTPDTSFVLMKNDQIVGFSLVRPTHGEGNAHLWMLGIHPDYRRKGLGKTLVQLIMRKSVEQGLLTMSVACEKTNLPAYSLYKSLGFKEEFTKIEYSCKSKVNGTEASSAS